MRTIRISLRTGRCDGGPHVTALSEDDTNVWAVGLDDTPLDPGPAWDTYIDVDILGDGTVLAARPSTTAPNQVTVAEPAFVDDPA